MKLQLRTRPRAREDVLAARDYFDEQQPGLGQRFSREIGAAIARARDFPNAWPLYEKGIRRARIGNFKYDLYYHTDRRRLTILRILHAQRDPDMRSALVGYEDE